MFDKLKTVSAQLLLATIVSLCIGSGAIAQESAWRVSKSSGDVQFNAAGAQPVALASDAALKPGDTIRTGQDGRVLLVRGAETILISANSVVGIPPGKKKEGMSTTILQQAGSILLDVEKRNVQHFEVATPYLAAVVKGTQFRVTVNNTGSHVDVLRGQVQVTDYKTGQYALVNPNQVARVSLQGSGGLSLSGSGTLSPIQQGTPQNPSVTPITTPSQSRAASDRTQNAQPAPAPVLAPVRQAERAPMSLDGMSTEHGWASDLVAWGKGVFGLNGRKNRNEDTALMLAVPAVIGFSVAIGAVAMRRRRKPKE